MSNQATLLMVMRDPLPATRPDVKCLFGELVTQGINSVLVGQTRESLPSITWMGGMAYACGRSGGMLMSALTPFFDLFSIIRALIKNKITMLQVRDKIASGVLIVLLAKLLRKKIFYWMSFPIVEGYYLRCLHVGRDKGALIWAVNSVRAWLTHVALYKIVLPNVDHIFVQSEAMKEWLALKGFSKPMMSAVPMGVDTKIFSSSNIAPVSDTRLDNRIVITYLGVLGKARQSLFLLDVITEILKYEPSALLLLIGDAPSKDEREWIRAEIQARSLSENVLLTGWLEQDQALRYLVRAKIGLSPIPRGELYDVSSPTKAVEYMALGIPCVGNDIPDQKLVIEKSQAGLCVPMTVPAFVDAIYAILNNESMHRKFAENGPRFVGAERSYTILARKVAGIYRTLIGS